MQCRKVSFCRLGELYRYLRSPRKSSLINPPSREKLVRFSNSNTGKLEIFHRVLAIDYGQFLEGGGDDLSIAGEQKAAVSQLQVLQSMAAEADEAPKICQLQIKQAEEMQPFEPARPCLILTYAVADPSSRISTQKITAKNPPTHNLNCNESGLDMTKRSI